LLDARAFNQKFRSSPVQRAKRRGYLRNVCIALGNAHHSEAIPALEDLLYNESEVLIRSMAAWALGQMRTASARAALEKSSFRENDPQVLNEISTALSEG
jgi:epoxyqueuosine reductase